MKITTITVYHVDLPLVEGNYAWSEGKSVSVFDSTVVAAGPTEVQALDTNTVYLLTRVVDEAAALRARLVSVTVGWTDRRGQALALIPN